MQENVTRPWWFVSCCFGLFFVVVLFFVCLGFLVVFVWGVCGGGGFGEGKYARKYIFKTRTS